MKPRSTRAQRHELRVFVAQLIFSSPEVGSKIQETGTIHQTKVEEYKEHRGSANGW